MKKNKLTIVIVNDFDYVQGGASKVAIDTANLLFKNNINVIFFSATHEENNYQFKQICTYQKECLKDGMKGAIRSLYNKKVKKEFSHLLDTLDKENTIIHVHGWTKSLSSVIFDVANKKGFKLVLTVHDYFSVCPNGGFYNYKSGTICTKWACSFNCITTNCDSRNYAFKLFRIIRQFIQNKNTKKIKNIKYMISISDFSIDKIKPYLSNTTIRKIYNPIPVLKKEFDFSIKENNYLYVGRLTKEKGVENLCEAVTEANKKLIIVGDGDLKTGLEKEYPNIEFVGWKKSSEVEKYMKTSKALIFPSKWYEGAPLTILEALCVGLPCIASNKCAAVDFIIDSKNGVLYDGTTNGLIKAIEKFEKLDLNKICNFAYSNYWKKPFDEERHYNELIKYYKEIVGEKNER